MPLSDEIIKKIEELNKSEVKELIKKLINTLDGTDIQDLMDELQDELEIAGMLKLAEETFVDWDNEEDNYYDNL